MGAGAVKCRDAAAGGTALVAATAAAIVPVGPITRRPSAPPIDLLIPVKGISGLGSPDINLTANGVANGPTQEQDDVASGFIPGLQTVFDIGNPAPFDVDPQMADVIQFAKDTGGRGFFHVLADLAGFEPAF